MSEIQSFTVDIGDGGKDEDGRPLVSLKVREWGLHVVWLALPHAALVALVGAIVTKVDLSAPPQAPAPRPIPPPLRAA